MVTAGPFISTTAPFPLEILMPESLIDSIAPAAVLRWMPPAGPGSSLMEMEFCPVVCKTIVEFAEPAPCAWAGTSAERAYQQPLHTGLVRSPCSNSTHTPAPIDGNAQIPMCGPAQGKQGMAHSDGVNPLTSGTLTCSRPMAIGSTLCKTVPRYFPKIFLLILSSPLCSHVRRLSVFHKEKHAQSAERSVLNHSAPQLPLDQLRRHRRDAGRDQPIRSAGEHLFPGAGSYFGRQIDRPASNHEHAFPLVMNRPRMFPRWVDPRFDDLKDKEVVFGDQLPINDLAFQIGMALGDEWGLDARGGHGGETKGLELVHPSSRSVPAAHHLFRQFPRRHADHAFPGPLQDFKRVVPVADPPTHDRRLDLHHRMPRHGHDVRPPLAGRRDHHDRSGLEQPIDLRQGKRCFFHLGLQALPRVHLRPVPLWFGIHCMLRNPARRARMASSLAFLDPNSQNENAFRRTTYGSGLQVAIQYFRTSPLRRRTCFCTPTMPDEPLRLRISAHQRRNICLGGPNFASNFR